MQAASGYRLPTGHELEKEEVQHRCGQQQQWSDGPSVDKDLDCQPADGS